MRTYTSIEKIDAGNNGEFYWLKATDKIVITHIHDDKDKHEWRDGEIYHELLNDGEEFGFNTADAIHGGTVNGVKLWEISVCNDGDVFFGFLFEENTKAKKVAYISAYVDFLATCYGAHGEKEGEYMISRSPESTIIVEYVHCETECYKEALKIIVDHKSGRKIFIHCD